MKFEMSNFQAVAANLPVGGEVCDIAYAKLSTWTESDTEIAPLIHKVGATSIAEIDRLMAELQEAKDHLQSERERIEHEAVCYTNLAQMASATVKIISDAVSQWHPAHNQRKSSASEVTAASTEDNIGALRKSNNRSHKDTSEVGQAAGATKGTQALK
jgi:hypothetical protein